ncbi:putative Polycomb group protein ASXL3 [Seriola aureovittata]|uniref:putative Polycomb group protein ASXL3 n=1 Tax=Seriola aureovittata TaxID=2871759 RepID=UPI0024BD660D|nr:putative Polycomb group protein ASXL3 [Seriola aureovittata]
MAQTNNHLFELTQWCWPDSPFSKGSVIGTGGTRTDPLSSVSRRSSRGLPPPPPLLPPDNEQLCPSSSAVGPSLAPAPLPSSVQPPPLPGLLVPRTRTYRKRKLLWQSGGCCLEEKPTSCQHHTSAASVSNPEGLTLTSLTLQVCHTVTVGGKTVEEWREEMKRRLDDNFFYLYL